MRIALLHDHVPFQCRAVDLVAEACASALTACGHEGILVRIPAIDGPSARLMASTLVVGGADRVIGLSFPAFLLHAPGAERMIWALDLGPESFSDAQFRQMLSVTRLYCSNTATRERIEAITGLRAVLLEAPDINDREGWRSVADELSS